jgi:hypothetical protein
MVTQEVALTIKKSFERADVRFFNGEKIENQVYL